MARGQLGPRALSLIGVLGTRYHLTQRKIRDLLDQLMGLSFSVGAISQDYIGVGVPKGEAGLTDYVNKALIELEADGRAGKIYNSWFGPDTKTPLARIFRIGDKS